MPSAEYQNFRSLVLSEPALQEKLMGFDSKNEFAAEVLKVGGEMGFSFTGDDVDEAMRAENSEWILRWI